MKRASHIALGIAMVFLGGASSSSCDPQPNADRIVTAQQAKMTADAAVAVPIPAIKNYREKRLLKMIYELRDQDGILTYAYTFSEVSGKLSFFCEAIGYGIPYSTQFSNPQVDIFYTTSSSAHLALPQAEPNGLFPPATADGTWVMCKDPNSKDVRPVYIEPKVVVSPFKLKTD